MKHLGTEIALQLPLSSCVLFMLGIATLILFFTCDTTSCSGYVWKGLILQGTILA